MNNVIKIEKEEILMPAKDKVLLKELYLLRSYSGFEEPMRRSVAAYLDALKIPYLNYNGNILGLNYPGAPLFSAHMDMVNTEGYILRSDEFKVTDGVFTIDDKTNIRLYRDKEKKKQTSLGADDKNGIWVILTLLKYGHKINFAFCHSEETGGTGSTQIVHNSDIAKFISKCQYGIVIDRRNAHDIIGYKNKYCLCLDDALSRFSEEKGFKFKPTSGSISDADRFSTLIECVNLSCGYYEPHTSKEYTNLNELWNTYLFCESILKDFIYTSASTDRIKEFKNITSYSTKSTVTTYYGKDDDEDYNYPRSYYHNATWGGRTLDEKKSSETADKTPTIMRY